MKKQVLSRSLMDKSRFRLVGRWSLGTFNVSSNVCAERTSLYGYAISRSENMEMLEVALTTTLRCLEFLALQDSETGSIRFRVLVKDVDARHVS